MKTRPCPSGGHRPVEETLTSNLRRGPTAGRRTHAAEGARKGEPRVLDKPHETRGPGRVGNERESPGVPPALPQPRSGSRSAASPSSDGRSEGPGSGRSPSPSPPTPPRGRGHPQPQRDGCFSEKRLSHLRTAPRRPSEASVPPTTRTGGNAPPLLRVASYAR